MGNLHDHGNEDGGASPLEQNVCQRLEDGVGHKEDAERGEVGRRAQLELGLQASNAGITDIRTVQEGQEVETAQLSQNVSVRYKVASPFQHVVRAYPGD